MVVSARRWLARIKFILLFLVLSYVLYQVFDVVTAWIEPDKYREPGGHAEKVFRHDPETEPYDSAAERLRLFYWYGE